MCQQLGPTLETVPFQYLKHWPQNWTNETLQYPNGLNMLDVSIFQCLCLKPSKSNLPFHMKVANAHFQCFNGKKHIETHQKVYKVAAGFVT